jgi:hypothetical protein
VPRASERLGAVARPGSMSGSMSASTSGSMSGSTSGWGLWLSCRMSGFALYSNRCAQAQSMAINGVRNKLFGPGARRCATPAPKRRA